jgi:hypothetical protein
MESVTRAPRDRRPVLPRDRQVVHRRAQRPRTGSRTSRRASLRRHVGAEHPRCARSSGARSTACPREAATCSAGQSDRVVDDDAATAGGDRGLRPQAREHGPTGFQGIHARYVLVIFDEATAVSPRRCGTRRTRSSPTKFSRILAIGNPDRPASEFERVCAPGSGWNVVPISAFDTPNFTGEAVPDDLHAPAGLAHVWQEESCASGARQPDVRPRCSGSSRSARTAGCSRSIGLPPRRHGGRRRRSPCRPIGRRLPTARPETRRTAKRCWGIRRMPNELGVDVGGGGDEI